MLHSFNFNLNSSIFFICLTSVERSLNVQVALFINFSLQYQVWLETRIPFLQIVTGQALYCRRQLLEDVLGVGGGDGLVDQNNTVVLYQLFHAKPDTLI